MTRSVCRLSGLSGALGVVLLVASFALNLGPPSGATPAMLAAFAQQHRAAVLYAAWLQSVGPALIVVFALALVHLAGAANRLSGWLVLFGAAVLMIVSLIEVTFYIGALFPSPAGAALMSLNLIAAVQHLYFYIAAPALFFPLGAVLFGSRVLPRVFAYLAVLLGAAFVALAALYATALVLPNAVTAFGAVQALWWLAAAVALLIRAGRLVPATPPVAPSIPR